MTQSMSNLRYHMQGPCKRVVGLPRIIPRCSHCSAGQT